jgi:hypothetical protein
VPAAARQVEGAGAEVQRDLGGRDREAADGIVTGRVVQDGGAAQVHHDPVGRRRQNGLLDILDGRIDGGPVAGRVPVRADVAGPVERPGRRRFGVGGHEVGDEEAGVGRAEAGGEIIARPGGVPVIAARDVLEGVRVGRGNLIKGREQLVGAVERAFVLGHAQLVDDGHQGGDLRGAHAGAADPDPWLARRLGIREEGVVNGDARARVCVVNQVRPGAEARGLNARLVGRLGFGRADAAAAEGPGRVQRAVGIARRVRGQRRAAHAEHVGRHARVFREGAAEVPGGSDEGDALVAGGGRKDVVQVIVARPVAEAEAHGNDGDVRLTGGKLNGRVEVTEAEGAADLHEENVGARGHRVGPLDVQ